MPFQRRRTAKEHYPEEITKLWNSKLMAGHSLWYRLPSWSLKGFNHCSSNKTRIFSLCTGTKLILIPKCFLPHFPLHILRPSQPSTVATLSAILPCLQYKASQVGHSNIGTLPGAQHHSLVVPFQTRPRQTRPRWICQKPRADEMRQLWEACSRIARRGWHPSVRWLGDMVGLLCWFICSIMFYCMHNTSYTDYLHHTPIISTVIQSSPRLALCVSPNPACPFRLTPGHMPAFPAQQQGPNGIQLRFGGAAQLPHCHTWAHLPRAQNHSNGTKPNPLSWSIVPPHSRHTQQVDQKKLMASLLLETRRPGAAGKTKLSQGSPREIRPISNCQLAENLIEEWMCLTRTWERTHQILIHKSCNQDVSPKIKHLKVGRGLTCGVGSNLRIPKIIQLLTLLTFAVRIRNPRQHYRAPVAPSCGSSMTNLLHPCELMSSLASS